MTEERYAFLCRWTLEYPDTVIAHAFELQRVAFWQNNEEPSLRAYDFAGECIDEWKIKGSIQ
jgi:hypothetical protein